MKRLGIFFIIAGLVLLSFPWLSQLIGGFNQWRQRRQFMSERQREPFAGREPLGARPGKPFIVTRLVIPKIGVDQISVDGTDGLALTKGPGHYRQTVNPGERGLAAFAGHRTTYTRPFNRLDELASGDKIVFENNRGRFLYRITKLERVKPDAGLKPAKYRRPFVALTTCDPEYSARFRLIAYGRLTKAWSAKKYAD